MRIFLNPCLSVFIRGLVFSKIFKEFLSGFVMLAAVGGLNCIIQAAPGDFIWLEAEQPGGVNIQVKEENTGHAEFLSEGKWFKVSIDAEKLEGH